MDCQQEIIIKLLQLINENPKLPIVPMVDLEVCCSEDYSYWMGSWGEARIDHYWSDDERIYFKENDFEDLVQQIIDNDNNYDDDFEKLSYEEKEKLANEIVEEYDWVKCITVSIDVP